MCFLDMPSVNWPKHICAGPQAISEESSVTCGKPSGVTVASRPIFNSGLGALDVFFRKGGQMVVCSW